MNTNEFRRNVHKTLDARPIKEAFKATSRKRRNLQIASEILGVKVAADQVCHTLNGFVLGFQLNEQMRSKAVEPLGEALHHAVALTKLLKVKAPAASRKIKPKSTITMLLTEMGRISGDMLGILYATHTPAQIEILTETRKTKPKDGTAPVEKQVQVQKFTPTALDEKVLAQAVEAFLAVVYEFSWAVYEKPAADLMAAHIKKLEPKFPKDFFAPPPKKPAPAGLKKAQAKAQEKNAAAAQ